MHGTWRKGASAQVTAPLCPRMRGARDIKDARWQELVYYFSATGNSKYVAEGIAGALGDEAQSIQGCDGRLPMEDVLGPVTPTYA